MSQPGSPGLEEKWVELGWFTFLVSQEIVNLNPLRVGGLGELAHELTN